MTSLPAAPPVFRVADVPELVATVPVLIGFRPRESLVLVSTGGRSGRRLGLTLRVDLPPPDDVDALAAYVASSLLVGRPKGAVLVVFAAADGPVRRDVVVAVGAELGARGVPVHTAVWAERAQAGASWACFDGCCAGLLPDPGATAAAAGSAAAGQVMHHDRSDLERLVTPTDAAGLRRRERRIVAATDGAQRSGGTPADDAAALAVLHRALDAAASGRLALDDDQVVALADALVRPRVRDSALLRCAEAEPLAGAETLFAALCRELPDPEAAEAAALLAASALLRGDGALANVALARAQESWPGHHLTELLAEAACRAVHPRELRRSLLRLRTVLSGAQL